MASLIRRVLGGSIHGIGDAWAAARGGRRPRAGEHDTSLPGTSEDIAVRRTAEAVLAEAAELREIERKVVTEHGEPGPPGTGSSSHDGHHQ